MSTEEHVVKKLARCPQCGREFSYDSSGEPGYLPFCSPRCQWVDLGRWLSGDYRVSRPIEQRDVESQD